MSAAAGGLEPYAPLGVLKPLGRDIWMVDGPVVRTRRLLGTLPLTTRMTVARLPDGRLWLHAPVALTPCLEREIGALGRVAALVLPERLCGAALADWQAAFPWAVTWCTPGLAETAAACGLRIDHELAGAPPSAWSGAIAQVLVRGGYLSEAVFLHRASRTLVLSDLVHNFERGRGPGGLLRRALRLGECGGTPPDLQARLPRPAARGARGGGDHPRLAARPGGAGARPPLAARRHGGAAPGARLDRGARVAPRPAIFVGAASAAARPAQAGGKPV